MPGLPITCVTVRPALTEMSAAGAQVGREPVARATWRGHWQIARVDHWIKNIFILPGIVAGIGLETHILPSGYATRIVLGLLAAGLVASSNYVINEIADAPFDRLHPEKCRRPIPQGAVSIPLVYAEWIVLGCAGLAVGWLVSRGLVFSLAVLWLMGCVYNIQPVRSKDVPFADVLTEAINNPLRLMIGWYIAGAHSLPPGSLLVSYWMIGCYLMALKRFSEHRSFGDAVALAAYRRSLARVSERGLLVSVTFYASTAMLCFGAFLMRYRMELVFSFPAVALVMAVYMWLAFRRNSAVEHPEQLYREPVLLASVLLCTGVMTVLLFIDLPWAHRLFSPDFLPR